jgi:hypothetical protein
MDLSQKANLNGWTAKQFLERKAEEFGAQRKKLGEEGVVYYFLTANALGSIFADSDPDVEEEAEPLTARRSSAEAPAASVMNISKILDFEEAQELENPSNPTFAEEDEADEDDLGDEDRAESEAGSVPPSGSPSLIQSELAKRLDTNSSTIGRRKADPDFTEWSQSRDPEGIAWKYLRRSRVFVPANPQKDSQS